jgi:hypothetical protein
MQVILDSVWICLLSTVDKNSRYYI